MIEWYPEMIPFRYDTLLSSRTAVLLSCEQSFSQVQQYLFCNCLSPACCACSTAAGGRLLQQSYSACKRLPHFIISYVCMLFGLRYYTETSVEKNQCIYIEKKIFHCCCCMEQKPNRRAGRDPACATNRQNTAVSLVVLGTRKPFEIKSFGHRRGGRGGELSLCGPA